MNGRKSITFNGEGVMFRDGMFWVIMVNDQCQNGLLESRQEIYICIKMTDQLVNKGSIMHFPLD